MLSAAPPQVRKQAPPGGLDGDLKKPAASATSAHQMAPPNAGRSRGQPRRVQPSDEEETSCSLDDIQIADIEQDEKLSWLDDDAQEDIRRLQEAHAELLAEP